MSNELYNFIKATFSLIILIPGFLYKVFKFIIKPSSILLIICFHIFVVIFILVSSYKLPKDVKKGDVIVAVYGIENRIGEHQLFTRTVKGANNIGWKVVEVLLDESETTHYLGRYCSLIANYVFNKIYKPDFNIVVTEFFGFRPYGYSVAYLTLPRERYIAYNRNIEHDLDSFNAYLDIHSLSYDNYLLKEALAKKNNKAIIVPGYLGVNKNDFVFSVPKKILITGTKWGCNRDSLRVELALIKLANNGSLVAYGMKKSFNFLGKYYKGRIDPKYIPDIDQNMTKLHQETGIALVILNLEHIIDYIPTSRISEAIGAGTIVITDDNNFTKKFFGNNVLYINSQLHESLIYKQINDHLKWIKDNPDQVHVKAKNAHEILMKNFTIEVNLQKLYKAIKGELKKAKVSD